MTITTMEQVKHYLLVHPGMPLYRTEWSDTANPQLQTTVYTGSPLWKRFNRVMTLQADQIVTAALDHPAIYLNVTDPSKGRPWPIGNNITLLPQHMAKVSFMGRTRDDHLAAVLCACAARWLVEADPELTMVYVATPWLDRHVDRVYA